jgi:hypothetical protein
MDAFYPVEKEDAMSYTGQVQNGVVVLDDGKPLPEGTRVRVEPLAPEQPPTLAEIFKDFIGIVDDLPADLAKNHDHYLHGQPKK